MRPLVLAVLVLALTSRPAVAVDLEAVLERMEGAYAAVQSYTARFAREERIGQALRPREEALIKFRRPGRLYLRWIAGPPKGREILFVEGRDDGKALVHEPAGLARLVTVVVAPDSPRVLRDSRHPITDLGLGRLVDLIVGNARRALRHNEVTVVDHGAIAEAGRAERRLELVLPRDPAKGYYCYRVLVAIDQPTGLPTGVEIFDWDDRFVASYAYRDLRVNAGLTALDFEPSNPEYGFPRWRLRW